jgi:hypothetical protein
MSGSLQSESAEISCYRQLGDGFKASILSGEEVTIFSYFDEWTNIF